VTGRALGAGEGNAAQPSRGPSSVWLIQPTKVNLTLRVLGRRSDGFHALETLVGFVDAGDRLRFEPAEVWSLTLEGPHARDLGDGSDRSNLIWRAVDAFQAAFGPISPLAITLDKRLPVASGLGGGSGNAAAVLRVLKEQAETAPDPAALQRLAVGLGSDVPMCLAARPALAWGQGERLLPVRLPPVAVLLVNPRRPVPTGPVFQALARPAEARWDSPPAPAVPIFGTAQALAAHARGIGNDLQPPAEALVPEVATVTAQLYAQPGCLYASMSGSGASCFGLYVSDAAANDAAQVLYAYGHWTMTGRLGDR